jgi:hypothetical protein
VHSIKKIIFKTLFVLFFFPTLFPAQDLVYKDAHFGFNFSANIAFGTHFQRVGLNLNFFYVYEHVQANSELRTYFSFKNLGPKIIYKELVLSQGIIYGYDIKQSFFNPFVNSISNQTGYRHSFSYAYNVYLNRIKTTQQTGLFALQFDKISVITENDILARPTLDRFRTGAFLIQYQYDDKFQAAINCSMWTGQMGRKMPIESDKVYSHCYMDTTGGVYSNLSHGLFSAQFKYNVGLSQNAQANIGIDAEQVRNVMQNKFIHDAVLIPKKWRSGKNCHIPMIDEQGNQYLYDKSQRTKAARLYLNLFTNAAVFY